MRRPVDNGRHRYRFCVRLEAWPGMSLTLLPTIRGAGGVRRCS
jgi:hypothetical protein